MGGTGGFEVEFTEYVDDDSIRSHPRICGFVLHW